MLRLQPSNADSGAGQLAKHQGPHSLYGTGDLLCQGTAKAKYETVAGFFPSIVPGEREKQESLLCCAYGDIEVVEAFRQGYRNMHSCRGAVHFEEISKFSLDGFDQYIPSIAVNLPHPSNVSSEVA